MERPRVLDPHYFHPNWTIRVAHVNYIHGKFPSILIRLISVVFELNFLVAPTIVRSGSYVDIYGALIPRP